MSHRYMSHESCHAYVWVMSCICTSHITYMYESFHIYVWGILHIWMSHVTYMYESWAESHPAIIHELTHVTQIYESWVMLHICISRVTNMYESCHIYVCVMSHVTPHHHPRTDSCHTYMYGSWVIHMRAMTHDSHTYVTHIPAGRDAQGRGVISHMCDMNLTYMRHDSYIYVTWLIHACDMTHTYMRHDSNIRAWRACGMNWASWLSSWMMMGGVTRLPTHTFMWHDSYTDVPWLIHICDMTHTYMWQESYIHVGGGCDSAPDSYIYVTWLIHITAGCGAQVLATTSKNSATTHNKKLGYYIPAMGWLRFVGSFKW